MSSSAKLYRQGKPLREIVGEEIRGQIFSGALPPGSRLVERELAQRFEVSRLPVREALRVLQNEGLVEYLPSRGMAVRVLDEKQVLELFDIREALEVLAARRASEHLDRAGADRLRGLVEVSRRAAAAGDLTAAHQANSDFHDQITTISGNSLLQDMLEPLHRRLQWLFRQIADFEQVTDEHDQLCRVIVSGDPEAAAAVAREHVLTYRRLTMEYLFSTAAHEPRH